MFYELAFVAAVKIVSVAEIFRVRSMMADTQFLNQHHNHGHDKIHITTGAKARMVSGIATCTRGMARLRTKVIHKQINIANVLDRRTSHGDKDRTETLIVTK